MNARLKAALSNWGHLFWALGMVVLVLVAMPFVIFAAVLSGAWRFATGAAAINRAEQSYKQGVP